MSSPLLSAGRNLNVRQRRPEIMDEPGLAPLRLDETLQGLGRVNAITRSAQLMWPDLKAAARAKEGGVLRVLDVACGGGDVLRALSHKARNRGLKLELAGCDASPEAVRFARDEATRLNAPIEFFALKVGEDALPSGYDMIMSTLFLHHLDDEAAVAFLREAAAKAGERMVIQDLVRSGLSYWFARLGTGVLLLNDICRLDGQASVEGAFTRAEARALAERAGLRGAEVVPRFPFRYLIRWIRR